jgi:hypothetical protein
VSKRAPRYIANTFSRRKNFNELACGTRTGSASATSSPLENVRSQRYFQITPRARPGKLLIFAIASACNGANSGPISQRRKIIIARTGGKSFDGQTM